ncbi:MAG: NusG domain II-containing protein [Peptoniphilaceae bacterium]|nr:NusG domain II-containing protein [Peptoniphilaceae bacterium]MDY6085262.1 NusG domain II-containing protein [Peptoniphilaceae bacterium]
MQWKEHTTRADRLLVAFLAVASLAALAFLFWVGQTTTSNVDVSIQVDGKEIERYALSELEGQSKTYKTVYGTNVLRVENGQAFILEADCPDKLCIMEGKIQRPGEILVCLPNRFMVELIARDASEPEVDVYLQ